MSGQGPLTMPGGATGLAFVRTKFSQDLDETRPDIELVMGAGSLAGDRIGILRSLLGKIIIHNQLTSALATATYFLKCKSFILSSFVYSIKTLMKRDYQSWRVSVNWKITFSENKDNHFNFWWITWVFCYCRSNRWVVQEGVQFSPIYGEAAYFFFKPSFNSTAKRWPTDAPKSKLYGPPQNPFKLFRWS